MRRRRLLESLAALAAVPMRVSAALDAPAIVRVAAASDLKFALAELAEQYARGSGVRVQLNLGSSGQFVQQIRQGLPVDLFMSADEDFVFQLADAGLTRDRGTLYALGRLAGIVPAASLLALDPELRGLRAAWAQVRHFAIANPAHAPYGRAAQQSLEKLELWQLVRPKLVLGENIAQTTQFITSGAADAGITALSLALAPEVARETRHVVLPESLHAPLRQRMVLLKTSAAAAAAFFDFLQSPAARAVFRRYGFAFD
jgi:molybdate transport system substrate-binding protein